LLKVHVTYGPLVQALLKRFNPAPGRTAAIRGLAHITGGGFIDNIPRVLPATCDVVVRKGSWEVLPLFQLLESKGGVPETELYQVFNMGIGMTVIVAADKADAALKFCRQAGHRAWFIGEVVKGRGMARIV
jgi:phosphoribosylformylglycinamidine cyclo-ligase